MLMPKTVTLSNFTQDTEFHQEYRELESFKCPKRYFFSGTRGERNVGQTESGGQGGVEGGFTYSLNPFTSQN